MNQKDSTRSDEIVVIALLIVLAIMLLISAVIIGFKFIQGQAIANAVKSDSVLLLEKTDDGYKEVNYGQSNFQGLVFKENEHWCYDQHNYGIPCGVHTYDTVSKDGKNSSFYKAKSFENNLEAMPNLPIISKQVYALKNPQQYKYTFEDQQERFGGAFNSIVESDVCGTYLSLQHAAEGSMELINE